MCNRLRRGGIFIVLATLVLGCNYLQPTFKQVPQELAVTTLAVKTSAPEEFIASTAHPAIRSTLINQPVDTPPLIEDGTLAMQYLVGLTQTGSRAMGTITHQKAASYILTELVNSGYSPESQPFKTKDGFEAANIIAVKPGNSDRVIIAGGHYDMVTVGSGVDDNGSGVAVLLEAARRLKDIETPYTIQFVFFDAEETGLEGSAYYVTKMTEKDIKNTVAMINLDSLAVGDYTFIYGNEGEAGAIRDWALEYANQNNLPLITQSGKNPEYPAGTTIDASDHAPFLHRGIQYACLEATNWDLGMLDGYTQVDTALGEEGEIWHTEFDTMDYIQKTFPGRMQEHLKLFSNVLVHILSEYEE